MPEESVREVREKIQPPSVSLKNYVGGDTSLVGKVNAMLAHGNKKVNANLQLQPDAGIDILVGADLLPQ